jgi:hypothetical protein
LDKHDLVDYFKLLANLDWYYQFSDDHGVWQRGLSANNLAHAIRLQSSVHTKMYDDWYAYMFKKGEKPVITNYI